MTIRVSRGTARTAVASQRNDPVLETNEMVVPLLSDFSTNWGDLNMCHFHITQEFDSLCGFCKLII